MKAIYYVRVSTGSQTYERQIEQIREFCKSNNIELLETPETNFAEIESGFTKVRPVLTKLEKFIEDNYVDYVIVSELSRLGRTNKVLTTIENLTSKNIGLVSIHEGLKTFTISENKVIDNASHLLIGILNSINKYEIDTFKFRSTSGLESAIRNGRAIGSLNYPYGYIKEGIKKQNRLVINPEEAEVIKKIFSLYLEGNGTQKIANILNEDGIETRSQKIVNNITDTEKLKTKYKFKKNWVDGTVYYILKNPLYIGKRRVKVKDNGVVKYELVELPQLKIIDEETFNKVSQTLSNNFNKANKHTQHDYLLKAGKIKCGICGKNYFAHKRSSGKDNTYKCISRRYKESCGNAGISISKIEYFIQQILLFLFEDKLIEKLDDKTLNKQIEDHTKLIDRLEKSLDKLEKEKLNIVRLKIKDHISDEEFEELNSEYIKRISKIKNELNIRKDTRYTLIEQYNDLKDIKSLKLKFKNGTKLPSEIVNKMVSSITLTATNDYPQDIFVDRTSVTTRNRKTKELVTRELKKDVVLEMIIDCFGIEYKFLISQLTEMLYYYFSKDRGVGLNFFFIDERDSESVFEDKMNRLKDWFNFIAGSDEG